jgi:hypothetical protein
VPSGARCSPPESPRAAWARLLAIRAPVYLDVPVLARKLPEHSGPSRLVLEIVAEGEGPLGLARVFPGEWYPGATGQRFSHYFLVLQRAYAGLEAEGREPRLRLQLLKAVNAGRDRPYVVLLKFVVAPEFAVAGGHLERLYQCPLAAYYQHFLGVARDVRRDARSLQFAAGQAIHRGYQRAAQAWRRTRDAAAALAEYDRAVVRAWTDDFAYYLLDQADQPTQLYLLPLRAGPPLVRRLQAQWPDGAVRLYQERLFYSPARGLVGRADRVAEPCPPAPPGSAADGPASRALYELKTTGYTALRDPLTGRRAAGGVQALAYHEILRSLDGRPPDTYVEIVAPEAVEAIPLADHPVVTRAAADVRAATDRYLDLFAQTRNLGYLVESGLLTGYDRVRIDEIAKYGYRLRGVGGDFALYSAAPPCRSCPVQTRGLCEDARYYTEPPWHDFFRHVPLRLYRYWAWFHRQLQAEGRAAREHFFRLATTPLARLEAEEGISLADLTVQAHHRLTVRLGRAQRIETRLREDDRVLVTPHGVPPGEVHSVEGTVRAIGEDWIEVELRDELAGPGPYRLDQIGHWERVDWQIEGLTDFLIGAMQGAGVRGRAVRLEELPRLARLLLGDASAGAGGPAAAPGAATTDLNPAQRQALAAALALPPGELLLIQGPPGTGKTALIAQLVREVVRREFWAAPDAPRPILLLANTHRACDELVCKLHERWPDLRPFLVRLGPAGAGMDPVARQYVLAERLRVREQLESIDSRTAGAEAFVRLVRQGRLLREQAAVFVGTLASAARPELRGLTFSYVVVDECGQATEPAALQALRHLPPGYQGRLVLVGDYQQLPPVVRTDPPAVEVPPELAAAGFRPGDGLRTSLFERLSRLYPERLVTLEQQYRMCAPVCAVVSATFYAGRLRPASPAVAARRLALGSPHATLPAPWREVWDPAVPVVFIDTQDDPAARDAQIRFAEDEARDNPREAALLADLLAALLQPLPPAEAEALAAAVGVISPYRRQNNRLRQDLRARLGPLAERIHVDTVDRFQGGEREVIAISLVASNPQRNIGVLHADWRRMNVAISRARAKLLLIGDRATFTLPGADAADAAVKERYCALFAAIEALAATGQARLLSAVAFPPWSTRR